MCATQIQFYIKIILTSCGVYYEREFLGIEVGLCTIANIFSQCDICNIRTHVTAVCDLNGLLSLGFRNQCSRDTKIFAADFFILKLTNRK